MGAAPFPRESQVSQRMAPLRILLHDYAGHPFPLDLSRELARRGHIVRHAYFAGDQGPKGRLETAQDDPAGLSITGIDLGTPYDKGRFLRRRFQDARYGRRLSQELARFDGDVVLSGNAPPDAQKVLLEAARRRRCGFVFWLQDSFGRGVRQVLERRVGALGRLAGRYYERLEHRLLRRSDAAVVIADDFWTIAQEAGLADGAVSTIPNWAPLADIPVRAKSNGWARRHGYDDKFVFLYSGTLGLKHDPGLLVALAEVWRADPAVRIVVASAGSRPP